MHPDITGPKLDSTASHKVAAFANDLLFFITNPRVSLPNLMEEFSIFGSLSNFQINYSKSEALNISIPTTTVGSIRSVFPFRWSTSAIKYLGTYIPRNLSEVFTVNFPPLLHRIKQDLTKWHSGNFSWFGRCSILKMNIMPRLLYLFQTLPIHVPVWFLRSVNRLFAQFLWAHKPPRLKFSLLRLPKTSGGIALPDAVLYYAACHLARAVDWCRPSDSKQWISVEQASSLVPLSCVPWCAPSIPSDVKSHPTIGATWKVCRRFFELPAVSPGSSPLFPLIGNPSFLPGVEDPCFRILQSHNCFRVTHFLVDGHWPSREQLMTDDRLLALGFWRTVQLSHFIRSLPSADNFGRPLTVFERVCTQSGTLRHTVSLMYGILLTPSDDFVPPYLLKWGQDLGINFSREQIDKILFHTLRSSISVRFQESGFKLLTRWYRTPRFLHAIIPSVPDTCWRCGDSQGDLLHIFWSCPAVAPFWSSVRRILPKFTDLDIPEDPAFFLLHHNSFPRKTYKKSLLPHLLNAARSCIPALWKQTTPPSVSLWLNRVCELERMEEVVSSDRGTHATHCTKWFYWREFVSSSEYSSLLQEVSP